MSKIPLFIYATGLEFQETNITPEILGEGVGGFTEVFKNRIVLPMDGSYHEFEKVLHHELTHAFQYDVIYGEGWRSLNLFKAVSVPTWMMEGMAEWNAKHLDGQGEMVLRDAVLNNQVLPLFLLDSFDHFEQVYMAYKESQSILDYISQVYGNEKVSQFFLKLSGNQPADTVAKSLLGVSLSDLYEHWVRYYKTLVWSRIKGMPEPERYGDKALEKVGRARWSPDGRQLACILGDRLFLLEPDSKKQQTILNKHFQTKGKVIDWSPDGNSLAFMATEEGEYKLYIYNLKTQSLQKFGFKGMPDLNSPSFSPNGRYLIFSAFDYQSSNLYRFDLTNQTLIKFTDDDHTKSWCQYDPTSTSIFYLDEWGGDTSIRKLQLDSNGLPNSGYNPVQLPKGLITSFQVKDQNIFFTSNASKKIFNLYKSGLNGGSCLNLTNSYADILENDLSPDGTRAVAIIYQKGSESLYLFNTKNFEIKSIDSISVNQSSENDYLSDSFLNAKKVIASVPILEAKTDSALPPLNQNSEIPPDDKSNLVNRLPSPVEKLEVLDSTNLIVLSWSPLDPDSNPVDGYRVYRSSSPEAPITLVGNIDSTKKCTFADYSAIQDKTYSYCVAAYNAAGEGKRSNTVSGTPHLSLFHKDYQFSFSPDILLFLAGYDSSFGFVGGGMAQMSDFLGDNRLSILGDTIPNIQTGLEANYELSEWRTTIDADFYYFQNYFQVYDLQSGNIVNQYRNNENGFDLKFTYPLDFSTRLEYGIGSQRFEGSPLYPQFSEGLSNYSINSNQWEVANFYTISFIKDQRGVTRFWPSNGFAFNLTLLQALPVFDANAQFSNLLMETQTYADFSFLNHLIWATRLIGMTSQGPDPQSFFIGDDAPFQAFFTTIRGYGGSTFFGRDLALINTELRYPLATDINFPLQPLSFLLLKDIELAGFMDAGMTRDNIQDIAENPILWSLGTGLRFYTSVYQRALVMFRFDVAWRLDGTYPPTFHFNLGPMF